MCAYARDGQRTGVLMLHMWQRYQVLHSYLGSCCAVVCLLMGQLVEQVARRVVLRSLHLKYTDVYMLTR